MENHISEYHFDHQGGSMFIWPEIHMIFHKMNTNTWLENDECFIRTIGGIVTDTVKLPTTVKKTTGTLFWNSVTKIKSMVTRNKNVEKQSSLDEVRVKPNIRTQNNCITESFDLRFIDTMRLLVELNLETTESINAKIQDSVKNENHKELETLCGITLLNIACASRGLSENAVLLANGNVLHRKDCSKQGIRLFDHVLRIKEQFKKLKFHELSNGEVVPVLLDWLPGIKLAIEHSESEQLDYDIRNVMRIILSKNHENYPDEDSLIILEDLVQILTNKNTDSLSAKNHILMKKKSQHNLLNHNSMNKHLSLNLNTSDCVHIPESLDEVRVKIPISYDSTTSTKASLSNQSPRIRHNAHNLPSISMRYDTHTHGFQILNQQPHTLLVQSKHSLDQFNESMNQYSESNKHRDKSFHGSLHRSLCDQIQQINDKTNQGQGQGQGQVKSTQQPYPLPLLIPDLLESNDNGIIMVDGVKNVSNKRNPGTKNQKIDIRCILDPITCEKLQDPVICNDGYLYNRTTAKYLINEKFVGARGIVITEFN